MIGDQASSRARCEWGLVGGGLVADGCDVAVVVDIASELDTSIVVPVLVDGTFRPA